MRVADPCTVRKFKCVVGWLWHVSLLSSECVRERRGSWSSRLSLVSILHSFYPDIKTDKKTAINVQQGNFPFRFEIGGVFKLLDTPHDLPFKCTWNCPAGYLNFGTFTKSAWNLHAACTQKVFAFCWFREFESGYFVGKHQLQKNGAAVPSVWEAFDLEDCHLRGGMFRFSWFPNNFIVYSSIVCKWTESIYL